MDRVSVLLMVTQRGTSSTSKTTLVPTELLNSPDKAPTLLPGGLVRSLQCKDTAQVEFQPWWETFDYTFLFPGKFLCGKGTTPARKRTVTHTQNRVPCISSCPRAHLPPPPLPAQHGTASRQPGSKARFLTHFFPP